MERSEYELGDQDYGSTYGWDPIKEEREERMVKAKKKDPKSYAETPNMLLARPIQQFVEQGSVAGELEQLFGPFWLESEVAVMYGMPGTGKSILALQLAESIARGIKLKPFNKESRKRKPRPKRVLYLDFELTREQLALRYSVKSGRKLIDQYVFSENLMRTELFWDGRIADGYDDFTDMLFENILSLVDEFSIEVIIIDNISFLTRKTTSNPTVAFGIMERLQQLKRERFLSILVVAHTPKHADTKPLTDIDLQGSVDLAKLADSMFVMGRSRVGGEFMYVKQVKSRSGVKVNSSDNVAVFRIAKRDLASDMHIESNGAANFLAAEFIAFETEAEHLAFRHKAPIRPPFRRRDAKLVAITRRMAKRGWGIDRIAQQMGIGRSTAHRYLTEPARETRRPISVANSA